MSRYAVFACLDCKISLFLGKIVFTPSDDINFFHRGVADARNWQRPELNRVLWKMLADHANHPLRVVTEGTQEYNTLMDEDLVWIGGDEPGHDISCEEYLKDWDG